MTLQATLTLALGWLALAGLLGRFLGRLIAVGGEEPWNGRERRRRTR